MSGKKLGHQVKTYEILVYTLEARNSTRFWWNLVRMFVFDNILAKFENVMSGQKLGHKVKS